MSRFGPIAASVFCGVLAGLAFSCVPALAELGPGQPGQYVRRNPPAQRPVAAPQIQQQPQRFVRPPVASIPQPQSYRPQPQVYRPQPSYQPPVTAYRHPERRWEHPHRYRPPVYFPPVQPPQVYYPDPPVYVEPYPVYGDYTPAYRPRRSSVIANYCETEIDTCELPGPAFVGKSCRCFFPDYGKVPGVTIE